MAIKIENNAEMFYRQAVEKISTPSLEPVLTCLADQEQQHARWFEKLKSVIGEIEAKVDSEELSGTALANLVGDQTFSLGEADLSQIENVEKLIELAIEHEKDTIIFYQMLQSFIETPETLKELDDIIAEEHRHIDMLKECRF
jgi:rubrerythrin